MQWKWTILLLYLEVFSNKNNTKKISEQTPSVDSVFTLIKHWYVRLIVP